MLTVETVDDLQPYVGREVAVSDWLAVTQELIDAFADVTGDRQWIHVDPVRAAAAPLGGTIAHGFLTLSLLARFQEETVRIHGGYDRLINYGLNKVRFPAPVRSGARIRSRHLLRALEDHEDFVQLEWHITVEVEGQSKPALVAEWLLRVYRR